MALRSGRYCITHFTAFYRVLVGFREVFHLQLGRAILKALYRPTNVYKCACPRLSHGVLGAQTMHSGATWPPRQNPSEALGGELASLSLSFPLHRWE